MVDPSAYDRVVTADLGSDLAAIVAEIGDGRGVLVSATTPEAMELVTTAAVRTGADAAGPAGEPIDLTPDPTLEDLHAAEPDPWGVDSRWYERRKRDLLLAALPRRRFRRAVEVGASTGALAADLATRCDEVLALDASATAVTAARERLAGLDHVRVERRSLPDEWPPAPPDGFDLVVLSEVGYFLSPAGLDALVGTVRRDLAADGVLVLCHWRHEVVGWPLDGPAVHAVVTGAGVRPVVATYADRDVELLVLADPAVLPDPAAAD